MNRQAMGKRINTARKDKNLTSDKLSELCNINATYLRQIEGGTKIPSLPVFVTICQALEVSPNYLLMDTLKNNEADGVQLLAELWEKATPSQIKLATAMIQCALDTLSESES